MANEKNIEEIYDLIEQFDFNELSDEQQKKVVQNISQEDYNGMRSTLLNTKDLFSKYPNKIKKEKKVVIKRIAVFPIELYKIVATIIILVGIGILFQKANSNSSQDNIFNLDTVFVTIIDTIIVEKTDTIEIIKEILVSTNKYDTKIENSANYETIASINSDNYFNKNITPENIEVLSKIKTTGNISRDSALSDFVVAVN